jgi:hypothetical protein
MLSAWASTGTVHLPFGLPGGGSVSLAGGVVVPPDVVPPEVEAGPPLLEGSPLLVPLAPPDELELASSPEQATRVARRRRQRARGFPTIKR